MSNNINQKEVHKSIFTSLVGKWSFKRSLIQYTDKQISTAKGVIEYFNGKDAHELKYIERGQFYLSDIQSFKFSREYQYVLEDDRILIYFVNEFGKKTHLFMNISFQEKNDGIWIANSEHVCSEDLYKGEFEIEFHQSKIKFFIISFNVKGPKKDYNSSTRIIPFN